MNTVGEPYSGKPNVRIDEGRPGEAVLNWAAHSTTHDHDGRHPPRPERVDRLLNSAYKLVLDGKSYSRRRKPVRGSSLS